MNLTHRDTTGCKPVQQERYITRKGRAPAPALVALLRSESCTHLGVFLVLSSFIACSSGPGTPPISVRTPRGASATAAETAKQKIVLDDVKFKADGSALHSESQAIVDAAAELLKNQPDIKVYVDAYSDPTGGKPLNLRLSRRRAATVTAYLEDHGIAFDRLTPRGFGATHFIASNDTVAGRAQNRRIELTLIDSRTTFQPRTKLLTSRNLVRQAQTS